MALDKEKTTEKLEAQLKEEDAKKVTGGQTNPIGGGILDNNDPEKTGINYVATSLDEYQSDLVGGRKLPV